MVGSAGTLEHSSSSTSLLNTQQQIAIKNTNNENGIRDMKDKPQHKNYKTSRKGQFHSIVFYVNFRRAIIVYSQW